MKTITYIAPQDGLVVAAGRRHIIRIAPSAWGYDVTDMDTGEVLLELSGTSIDVASAAFDHLMFAVRPDYNAGRR